jgi:hypothetical protein
MQAILLIPVLIKLVNTDEDILDAYKGTSLRDFSLGWLKEISAV